MNEKLVWHLKDKRHYVVDRETPAYYFLRVGKNTVKQVHKNTCVDSKPADVKNSYTIKLSFNKPMLASQLFSSLPSVSYKSEATVKLETVKSLATVTVEVYNELNNPNAFIKLGPVMYRKSDIFSIEVTENA